MQRSAPSRSTWFTISRPLVWLSAALALVPWPTPAQDVPQSVALPTGINTGGTSFLDGFTRTTPGWGMALYLRHTRSDAIKDSRGNNSPAFRDPKIDVTAGQFQFIYASDYKVFDGVLGLNMIGALVNLDSSFASDSPAKLSDNGFGLGDFTIGPYIQMLPVMRNGRPVFSQRFELSAIAPVGSFDRNRNINQGSGQWSTAAQWAMTVLPTPNWEISARFNYIYNFRTDKAGNVPEQNGFRFRNGQAGDAAWVNFAASREVAPDIRLGLNGYYLKQLRDDRTNGQRVPGTRQTWFYLGPGASWKWKNGDFLNVNLYLPVDVRNASAGNSLNVQYIHTF
ncbi:transporter [Brenneria populi subsp. brevivirga]|uniref:SphA family protein n=1 Tax=Brenneria populi TaxID=1505588 RepID=UPI002E18224B|nr:transporter [Brenneria populi subsp. brevivirga]